MKKLNRGHKKLISGIWIKNLEENILVNLLLKQFLKAEIEIKRRIMYKKAKDLGFTHPIVVDYSQELDVLLNRYLKQAQAS